MPHTGGGWGAGVGTKRSTTYRITVDAIETQKGANCKEIPSENTRKASRNGVKPRPLLLGSTLPFTFTLRGILHRVNDHFQEQGTGETQHRVGRLEPPEV